MNQPRNQRRSITIAGEVHAGENLSFRIQGIPVSHTFRADRTIAENLVDLHAALAPRLRPPFSVSVNPHSKTTLTFVSEWNGWDVDLRDVEVSGGLTVTEGEPAAAVAE